MKKTPLVSVIIPVYNEEKYLDFCLSSLSNQSYPKKEIIIVDDGSTDKGLEICQKFNVQILRQEHQGPGAARNLGVAHAKGEIIVLADADMRYDRKYIENLIKPILLGEAIGTFIKEEYVANPENIWSRCWNINAGLPQDRRLPEDYPDTENAFRAIQKKYFLQGEGYDIHEGYCDDSSLSRKINIKAKNSPDAISYHYNPSSLSEVFYSARWIGRSVLFRPGIISFLRYSLLNSLRISMKYILRGAPYAIIPFKVVFDFGMFIGIFLSHGKRAK
jgi:glycosyltransferase involved in cell wall biosynthesis